MTDTEFMDLESAILSFRHARFRAKLEQIVARLTGESNELLEYEDVRKKLKGTSSMPRGLQNIPINAIVGSVGRYSDFTRSFLPRQDSDEGRWARVQRAMTDSAGLPPIQVYQIGQAYFVLDGNHRVSVARALGASHVQAYVTEIGTKVRLSPDVQPDDLIVKAEYADFLEHTRLDRSRPQADLTVSIPGQYQKLEEHISVHRYFMGIDQERDIPDEEAVTHWYDMVYLPVVHIVREQGILRDFPNRTETDLYLWILDHRAELGGELHWEISPEAAASDLVDQFSPKPQRVVARVGEKVSQAVIPEAIVSGPPPGTWRQEQIAGRQNDRLFATILVAVGGERNGWYALDQALQVGKREGGQLVGLRVVPSEARKETQAVRAAQAEFKRRCDMAGVPGHWIVEVGSIATRICEWSRWAHLTIVTLSHPPDDQPIGRLSSGFRSLIQHCSTPILAVPQDSAELTKALLAYDGSPKSNEALFVSTYLAGKWGLSLVVLTVLEEERTTSDTLAYASRYLKEHGVEATFVAENGPVGEAILNKAHEHGTDLIVMGGYGFSPVVEIILGSAVDQVLRESRQPVLICR